MKRLAKKLLGQLAFGTGFHRRLFRGRAVIVAFHQVDARYVGTWINTSPERFREFCLFFRRYFDVIGLGDLVGKLSQGQDVSGCLAITFDDGYRDNVTVAAPILQELGLPACFFVTTGFVGSTVTPWWDQRQGIDSEWMSWAEVRALRCSGFEIGAHTRTHVDLCKAEGADAVSEIRGSRLDLERELREPITLFSYPFGRKNQLSEDNRAEVRRAGFVCCASCYGGTISAETDPFRLPRVPITNWHLAPEQFGFEVLFER
jgi:peptidoglycan/xylan/chitin deacetylase (PgdA/CDA1 family)